MATPTGVSVSMSSTTLTVTWDAVTDAAEYKVVIENHSSSSRDLVRFNTTTTIVVPGLSPRTLYCARVTARTITHQSPYSTSVCT